VRHLAVVVSCAVLLSTCACDRLKGGGPDGDGTGKAGTPMLPAGPDVPFKGTYTRYAKVTYKDGQRIQTLNAKGVGTLTIEPGRVTFAQTYNDSDGREAHVTQTYSFGQNDVRPITGSVSGYDVALTFVKMDSDTKRYSPDKRNPQIQARKQASGWQIGLLLTDDNGVSGGQEFR
jgi:hypothetical protein